MKETSGFGTDIKPSRPNSCVVGSTSDADEKAVVIGAALDFNKILAFVALLRQYLRLYVVVLAILIVLTGVHYWTTPHTYTAVAVVGPPAPSPTESMIGMIGSAAGGLGGRLLGAANSNAPDPYDSFQQLLPSTRLAESLAGQDQFLRAFFSSRWDADAKQWKHAQGIGYLVQWANKAMNMPSPSFPNADAVGKALELHLTVKRSTKGGTNGLLAKSSPYLIVSIDSGSPESAEALLSTILAETDRLVREDQWHDVVARIGSLKAELARQNLTTEERTTLISILSTQEQLYTMIQADKRYASALVVPPYAPRKPTSPVGLGQMGILLIILSLLSWSGIVFLSTVSDSVRKWTAMLRRENLVSAPIVDKNAVA